MVSIKRDEPTRDGLGMERKNIVKGGRRREKMSG